MLSWADNLTIQPQNEDSYQSVCGQGITLTWGACLMGIFIYHLYHQSVQSLSRVQLFTTPWIAARQASLSITNSQSSLRLMSIESVMPSSHLILCRPLPSFGVLFNYFFCKSQHPPTSQVINANNLISHLPYFSLCLRLISKYVCESITVRSSTKNTIFHTSVFSKSTAVHTSPITIISTV